MAKPKERDFRKFSARKYLEDYYYSVRDVDRFLLKFYYDVYRKYKGHSLLEVGGGPVVIQLISASRSVDEIIFSEYSPENRAEVIKFARNRNAYNLDKFFKYVLKLEGQKQSKKNVEKIKSRLRKKIIKIIPCDLRKKNSVNIKSKFDIVSVNFCPESITDVEEEFRTYVMHCYQYLKKGGIFVITLLRNATSYWIRPLKFPAFPVDEKYMKRFLSKDFKDIRIRTIRFKARGMDGNMAIVAVKK